MKLTKAKSEKVETLSMLAAAVGSTRDLIRRVEERRMECVAMIHTLNAEKYLYEKEIKEIRAGEEEEND